MSEDDDINPPAGKVLSCDDLASPTWRKLREHIEAKRDTARRLNDDIRKDAIETAFLRGRLSAFKDLLALASPAQAIAANEDFPE